MAKQINFRSDSLLGNLPAERQEQIAEFLMAVAEGDRYEATRAHLAEDGLKVSRSAVVRWFTGWRFSSRITAADAFGQQMQEAAKATKLGFTADQLEEIGQIGFVQKAMEEDDAATFVDMASLRLAKNSASTKARQKDADLKLAERRVAVIENKIKQASKQLTKIVEKGGLSTAALKEIEKAAKILQ